MVDGQVLEFVTDFKCVGSLVQNDAGQDKELNICGTYLLGASFVRALDTSLLSFSFSFSLQAFSNSS